MKTPTYSRRFYVFWFGLFTLASMALNGIHAYVTAYRSWLSLDTAVQSWLSVNLAATMPPWFATVAVSVSQIPPIALACATNALVKPDPGTSSGRGTAARSTTWTIATGAFVFSAIAMTDVTHMFLGVPLGVAAIMPVIVDISIVAAVLRLEIRRDAHRDEAHLPAESPQVEDVSPPQGAAVNRATERLGASQEAVLVRPESLQEAVVKRTGTTESRPKEQVSRPAPSRDSLILTRPVAEMARLILAESTVKQPVETVEKVLEMTLSGASLRDFPKAKVTSASTAGRIIAAARKIEDDLSESGSGSDRESDDADMELDLERRLAVVGS